VILINELRRRCKQGTFEKPMKRPILPKEPKKKKKVEPEAEEESEEEDEDDPRMKIKMMG